MLSVRLTGGLCLSFSGLCLGAAGDGSHLCLPLPRPGPWFNIKMTSYQYRESHCRDKTVVRPSYLHNGISYTETDLGYDSGSGGVSVPVEAVAPFLRLSIRSWIPLGDIHRGEAMYISMIDFWWYCTKINGLNSLIIWLWLHASGMKSYLLYLYQNWLILLHFNPV